MHLLSPGAEIHIPILPIRKPTFIAVESIAQDSVSGKWRNDLNPSPSDTKAHTLRHRAGIRP